jgi:L-ascorbate metabolism protein UlaG (beta-lactamase superfamily)
MAKPIPRCSGVRSTQEYASKYLQISSLFESSGKSPVLRFVKGKLEPSAFSFTASCAGRSMVAVKQAQITSMMAAGGVLLVVVAATCCKAPRMPALDGAIVEVRRSDGPLRRGDSGYESTLQIYWFGTACHLIQLGDARVLTDPFVTNRLSLNSMESDPQRVAATLARIQVPDAVLVNHSHHDHILDGYAAMSLDSWRSRGVPLFGGRSCRNLLAGWRDEEVLNRCHVVADDGGSFPVRIAANGYSVRVTAYRTEHSPHLKCGYTLANGMIKEPRTSPPKNFFDYQCGETFNFLVEMSGPAGSFRVFYLGSPFDLDKRPESIPPAGTPIDVVIMLAPSAENVRGYPEEHLARLRPRHIILSHFNTFAKEDPDEQLSLLGIDFAGLPKLSRDIQSTFVDNAVSYPEFEKLHIPAITVMGEQGDDARNVIRIR